MNMEHIGMIKSEGLSLTSVGYKYFQGISVSSSKFLRLF
jgi:hypothetical protein